MPHHVSRSILLTASLLTASLLTASLLAGLAPSTGRAEGSAIHYVDQGPGWSADTRKLYYDLDQGSRLIPEAWLNALKQPDGAPFLDGALGRYGYLANPGGANGLPLGFSLGPSALGPTVGMTCAACHARDLTVDKTTYRIDGGPSFGDFGALVSGLDVAVRETLATDTSFKAFAASVLGPRASDPAAVRALQADVALWSVRLHTLVSRSFPLDKPWGPARLDAMGLIYDFLVGTDIGPAPTYLIPDNILRADAPARYPFLWDEFHQDFNQWGGFQKNGTDILALARNLGEVIGVFATFHPTPLPPAAPLNVDYLSQDSGNFAGLQTAEGLVRLMGPPVWPWAVDKTLAAKGEAIFNLSKTQGGCADCHGIAPGEARDNNKTWRTRVLDVGTDTRAWPILLRSATTGALKGANIPGYYGPLKDQDLAINILKVAVVGAISEYQAKVAPKPANPPPAPPAPPTPNPSTPANSAPIVVNGYEARVLRGIWAAAPYLHNGSVPTLTDLLTPPAERSKGFKVGTAYDPTTVGLASDQPTSSYTLTTTGCGDLNSGNSNCGHDYGTTLSAADKAALLEYLKTL